MLSEKCWSEAEVLCDKGDSGAYIDIEAQKTLTRLQHAKPRRPQRNSHQKLQRSALLVELSICNRVKCAVGTTFWRRVKAKNEK